MAHDALDALANTYWYVTAPELPALEFHARDDTLTWLRDQTVWHISGSRGGYFWGVAAVMMTDVDEAPPTRGPRSRPLHLTLLGTVTPSGRVQITFLPQGPGPTTIGFGALVKRDQAWAFEMQMSTDRARARVLHWATMVQTRAGDESWACLPGVERSVPELLAGATYPTPRDA